MTALNSRIGKIYPVQGPEVHKTRTVLNKTWDMQVLYIKGAGHQATYFEGAEPKIWSDCRTTPEQAAFELDQLVDKLFGKSAFVYVKVQDRVPVPIEGKDNAIAFAKKYDAVLLSA